MCIRAENENQASFSPFGPHEIFVLIELTLKHLRSHSTDVLARPPDSAPDQQKKNTRGTRSARPWNVATWTSREPELPSEKDKWPDAELLRMGTLGKTHVDLHLSTKLQRRFGGFGRDGSLLFFCPKTTPTDQAAFGSAAEDESQLCCKRVHADLGIFVSLNEHPFELLISPRETPPAWSPSSRTSRAPWPS